MKKKFLLTLCILTSIFTYAQQKTINGTVKDQQGTALAGVSVVVKGSKVGTQTDFDGNFSLEAQANSTLVVSYVGYKKQEVSVGDKSKISVVLAEEATNLSEVSVTGTRNPNRVSLDSPVAVDVLDMNNVLKSNPQVNLNQILNYVAPSFTSNTQTISDGTDHIDPASLRGLGPDQVLVLVNGKRRHNTSLININGTFGRGNVGTDLNAIPASSIQKIEVLRDGAAAQYGSDAIAGVINIILKKDVNKLNITSTTGAYFSENSNKQTGGVDGETTNLSANYGLKLGEKGGFINFSGDFDYRSDYNRMKEWQGNIFNRLNAVEWQANKAGFDISNLYTNYNAISTYAQQVPHFDATLKGNIAAAATANDIATLRTLLSPDATANELATRGLKRTDFNMRVGQSALRGSRFFANMSLPLDENGTELYSFAGMSTRHGNSAGFYRMPNEARTFTPMYINGFLPEINSKINDKSLAVGIKGKVNSWDVDFSNTFGKNMFLYEISNTSNASMLNSSPNRFDAGGYSFAQNTTNLDIRKFYEDIFSGFNVAFGLESRVEKYEIYAGELGSYSQYDVNGMPITTPSQTSRKDFFNNTRPGGSQVFPGFSPANELSRGRNSLATYLDLEADITDKFLLSFATRFEDYSDFGSTLNFKLASRLKLNDKSNVRFAANTGFRAPSLHQIYFNSTSTVFDNFGNPQEVGTFSNDSKAAKLLGIPNLKEETSKSVSLGFTTSIPTANIKVTVDGYWVGIDDRIVYTGQFVPGTNAELQTLFSQAGASRAAFFANAIDTESKGLDVVLVHQFNLGKALVKTDLAGTFAKTKRVGGIKASDLLRRTGLVGTYFNEESRVYLEESVPQTKLNLSNNIQVGDWNFFLRNVYFGKVKEAISDVTLQQEFSSKIVTDLSVSYKLNKNLNAAIGANNLLDVYPDKAALDLNPNLAGNQNNQSLGRFEWSRRSQQFGIGGRFMFARLSFTLD